MNNFILLAQAETTGETAAPAGEQTQTTTQTTAPGEEVPAKPKPGLLGGMLVPMLLIGVVMYFFVFRGPKRKQQQQKQMLANMKKNDRVRTIGGIIGTVVDLRDDEVVIKIDESNNTKIRMVRSAIGTVITEEAQEKK